MTGIASFTVARAHLGDRITDEGVKQHQFEEGSVREADPAVVAHLVRNGVLVAGRPPAKADDEPIENKSEAGAAENKGATKPKPKAKG